MSMIQCIASKDVPDSGFFTDLTFLMHLIEKTGVEAKHRTPELESDPAWRQLVVYAVVQDEHDRFLTYDRAGTEKRLHGLISLGVGGHVEGTESIRQAIERELFEEIGVVPNLVEFCGLLALDTTITEQVHLGIVIQTKVIQHHLQYNSEMLNAQLTPASFRVLESGDY